MADRSYPIRANRVRDMQQATLASADYNERQAVALERIADALEALHAFFTTPAVPIEPPPPVDNEHVAEGAQQFDLKPPKEASDG